MEIVFADRATSPSPSSRLPSPDWICKCTNTSTNTNTNAHKEDYNCVCRSCNLTLSIIKITINRMELQIHQLYYRGDGYENGSMEAI